MARTRLIKPGFFTNEEIVNLAPETQLLFIGLWTLADRDGRLEDRPTRIKMQIFPVQSYDVDVLLAALASAKLIHRYKSGGKGYICIPNFQKHQHPHPNESKSIIPPMKVRRAHVKDRSTHVKDVSAHVKVDSARALPSFNLSSRPRDKVILPDKGVDGEKEREREREVGDIESAGNGETSSLSFSPHLENIVKEIQDTKLYAADLVPKVAQKQRVYLGRDPTRKELLGWLNREYPPRKESNESDGTAGNTKAKIARVVQDLVADHNLDQAKSRGT